MHTLSIVTFKLGGKNQVDKSIDTIDYVIRIGNSSHAPIVIVDFATAHPGCNFLCRIPALITEGVGWSR